MSMFGKDTPKKIKEMEKAEQNALINKFLKLGLVDGKHVIRLLKIKNRAKEGKKMFTKDMIFIDSFIDLANIALHYHSLVKELVDYLDSERYKESMSAEKIASLDRIFESDEEFIKS